jgi:hypothetical protein
VNALGRWYLHAVASVPAALAVLLLARRIDLGLRARWRVLEVFVIVAGIAIALSYWLKAAIILPLLTVLLFAYFVRRRAAILLWLGGIGLAVVTPFVYLVRGSGRIDFALLTTQTYWQEFADNLSSRFFHFESLMITTPFGATQPAWQPFADFVNTVVPRVLWEDKPLSAAARFSDEYLRSGLHSQTDVGVLSLPGEIWLVGGAPGIVVCGVLIGVLLRLAHTLVRHSEGRGTLLLAAGLVTTLLFLNDGWGLASAAVTMLIASAGWLVMLRRPASG